MSDDISEQPATERRKGGDAPPGSVERRQSSSRKKMRAGEGLERNLDMVQRERSLMLEQGIARSTEQLLDMAGAVLPSDQQEDETIKESATGDQLRAVLPVQSWLPLSIHLVAL